MAETKENLREVVELRQALSNELRAWREQKELMESQLRLDRRSLRQVEAQLEESRSYVDSLIAERNRLNTDLEGYRNLIYFWQEKLDVLRQRLGKLVAQFPPGLKSDMVAKFRDLETVELVGGLSGLRRAFEISMEIIREANAFHSEIHLVTEIHQRKDGKQGQFSVIYLGLSGGYYFSAEAGQAGRIIWKNGQWSWIEETKWLDALMGLEGVISKRDRPRFVGLPFTLNREGSQ